MLFSGYKSKLIWGQMSSDLSINLVHRRYVVFSSPSLRRNLFNKSTNIFYMFICLKIQQISHNFSGLNNFSMTNKRYYHYVPLI